MLDFTHAAVPFVSLHGPSRYYGHGEKKSTCDVHRSGPGHLHIVIVGVFSIYACYSFTWYAGFELNPIIFSVGFFCKRVYVRQAPLQESDRILFSVSHFLRVEKL